MPPILRLNFRPATLAIGAVVAVLILVTTLSGGMKRTDLFASRTAPTGRPKLQVLKAGGIPEEGLGSSLGFILATANIANLLDADLLFTQTAVMHGFNYRVSDILNNGLYLNGGPGVRTCDIMEIVLDTPDTGMFQSRMDRAQENLDELYKRSAAICKGETDEPLFNAYSMREIKDCDVIVLNDYRVISRDWTPCSQAWWKKTIDPYSGPAHGNDVAIHFRWGDMAHKVKAFDAKWHMDMAKIAPLVDIIREENPTVQVNVFMQRSKKQESLAELREILAPLSGDFNVVEATSDVEELAMMSKARYLFANSGYFSTAAAATGEAQAIMSNLGDGLIRLRNMGLKNAWRYDDIDLEVWREAVRPK